MVNMVLFPVLVQQSSMTVDPDTQFGFPVHNNEELDLQRRQFVVQALTEMGISNAEDRVVVSPAIAPGFESFEAERAYHRASAAASAASAAASAAAWRRLWRRRVLRSLRPIESFDCRCCGPGSVARSVVFPASETCSALSVRSPPCSAAGSPHRAAVRDQSFARKLNPDARREFDMRLTMAQVHEQEGNCKRRTDCTRLCMKRIRSTRVCHRYGVVQMGLGQTDGRASCSWSRPISSIRQSRHSQRPGLCLHHAGGTRPGEALLEEAYTLDSGKERTINKSRSAAGLAGPV